VKWLADECFDNDIIRGLLRRAPEFDLVRAQDVSEVAGRDDETLLAWAGKNDRVILTHDLATMVPALRFQRLPGFIAIVVVPDSLPIGQVIEDVLLLDRCSTESD
jgi:predicted nuclease of predicted toxin-antitoxin system